MDWGAVNWGPVANWVSGIGSLSAVITALYLAQQGRQVRLSGYCRLQVGVGGGPKQEYVTIAVANVGSRSTVVTNIVFRVGLFQKRHVTINTDEAILSDGLPKAIADGEFGHWDFHLNRSRTWIADLCKDFVESWLDVETMRIEIYTTNGKTKCIRPEKRVRQLLHQVIGKQNG